MRGIRRNGSSILATPLLLLWATQLSSDSTAQTNPPAGQAIVQSCTSSEIEPGCSEGRSIQVNGISLYYEERGLGEPLLLLHGGGGSAEHFNRMLPELTKHFRVITPDSRAQGRSTDTREPLTYRQMVEDMVGLLDSLGVDAAYLGGWSDGAALAIYMAIHHPERVRALLLTPVDLSSEGLTEVYWKDAAGWNLPPKLESLWYETRVSPTTEELAGIRVPTLFVIGEKEQYIKPEHITWQYNAIPDAEVVSIPDASHFLVWEMPEDVSQAFISFLQKH